MVQGLINRIKYQICMLKHRPSLWWQFHRKYDSCDDPQLNTNIHACTDMDSIDRQKYFQRLIALRNRVHQTHIGK